MKNRSYRYDRNRPKPRHGHRYTKYIHVAVYSYMY